MVSILQSNDLVSELTFLVSRSSGPGGQNVNKVNSRVTLKWDLLRSVTLQNDQKELLLKKLASRLTKEGVLMLSSQDSRSQLQNKEAVLQKLDFILAQALTPKKTRKKTKPTKAARQKRIRTKKLWSEKKQWRQKF